METKQFTTSSIQKNYEPSSSSFRWLVFILCNLSATSIWYCYDLPGSIVDQLIDDYNLTTIQYNLLYMAYAIPNIFTGLWLGKIVDRIGFITSLILVCAAAFISQIVFLIGCYRFNYILLLISRVMLGVSLETILFTTAGLSAIHFKGQEISFGIATQMSFARIGSSLVYVISANLYSKYHNLTMVAVVPCIMLGILTLSFIVLYQLNKRVVQNKTKEGYSIPHEISKEHIRNTNNNNFRTIFHFQDVQKFELLYWCIIILLGSTWGVFVGFANIQSSFLQNTYHYTYLHANHLLSLIIIFPLSIIPILAYFWDRMGHRTYGIIVGLLSILVALILWAFFSYINVLAGLFFFQFGYALFDSSIWPAIGIIIDPSNAATAYGLNTVFYSVIFTIYPFVVGILTTIKRDENNQKILDYNKVILFLFFSLIISLLLAIFVSMQDKKTNKRLLSPSFSQISLNPNSNLKSTTALPNLNKSECDSIEIEKRKDNEDNDDDNDNDIINNNNNNDKNDNNDNNVNNSPITNSTDNDTNINNSPITNSTDNDNNNDDDYDDDDNINDQTALKANNFTNV